MKNHKWDFLAASLALLSTAGYLWYSEGWHAWHKGEKQTLTQSLYLVPQAKDALAASGAASDLEAVSQVFVLVHDGDTPVEAPDWTALATCGKPVMLAFHYPPSLAADIEARLPAVAWKMGSEMTGACVLAEQHGVDVRGIHIDYDAPLTALGEYETFLQRMTWRVPANFSVSIGVAPEWIDSAHFANLTRGVHSFVLVLKEDALSREATKREESAARVMDWIARAEKNGRPYAIEFRVPIGFVERATDNTKPRDDPAPAGSDPPALSNGVASMAHLVRDLREASLTNLRGFVWHPVPAAPEVEPWPRDAFSALVAGRIPVGEETLDSTQHQR